MSTESPTDLTRWTTYKIWEKVEDIRSLILAPYFGMHGCADAFRSLNACCDELDDRSELTEDSREFNRAIYCDGYPEVT